MHIAIRNALMHHPFSNRKQQKLRWRKLLRFTPNTLPLYYYIESAAIAQAGNFHSSLKIRENCEAFSLIRSFCCMRYSSFVHHNEVK